MRNTVIFDMDGTIYDTEKIYKISWLEAGVPLDLYFSFIGTSRVHIRNLLTENGFDPDEVFEKRGQVVERELAKGIEIKPGAVEALTWLKENGCQAGRTPDECVVVEDSFNGVRAGHAAGMYTVMVPDLAQPDDEMRATADIILPTLGELPACLMKLK